MVATIVFGMSWYAKRSERGLGAYIPVGTADETLNMRHDSMMHNHLASTLMFRKLSYNINVIPRDGSTITQKTVLYDVQGIVRPGQVMAIIGGIKYHKYRVWCR